MKQKIVLLRHGETESEFDDALSERGISLILKKKADKEYPVARYVYSSDLSYCRQTASLIYSAPVLILDELNGSDNGIHNGRAGAKTLNEMPPANWSEPQALRFFPNAEASYSFDTKAKTAYLRIISDMKSKAGEQCALVANKMILLAILRYYSIPRSEYADWEFPYGGGYLIEHDYVMATVNVISRI